DDGGGTMMGGGTMIGGGTRIDGGGVSGDGIAGGVNDGGVTDGGGTEGGETDVTAASTRCTQSRNCANSPGSAIATLGSERDAGAPSTIPGPRRTEVHAPGFEVQRTNPSNTVTRADRSPPTANANSVPST